MDLAIYLHYYTFEQYDPPLYVEIKTRPMN